MNFLSKLAHVQYTLSHKLYPLNLTIDCYWIRINPIGGRSHQASYALTFVWDDKWRNIAYVPIRESNIITH